MGDTLKDLLLMVTLLIFHLIVYILVLYQKLRIIAKPEFGSLWGDLILKLLLCHYLLFVLPLDVDISTGLSKFVVILQG